MARVLVKTGAVLILALLLAGLGFGEERAGVPSASGADASQNRADRLRFRRGPVCMCAGGLSEKDIRDSTADQRSRTANGGESAGDLELDPVEK